MVSGFTSTFATVAVTTKATSLIPICADFVHLYVIKFVIDSLQVISLPVRIGHQKNIVENVIEHL
jgi:hypothetical protein